MDDLKLPDRVTDEDIFVGPPVVSESYHDRNCASQMVQKQRHMNYGEAVAAENKRKQKLPTVELPTRGHSKGCRGSRKCVYDTLGGGVYNCFYLQHQELMLMSPVGCVGLF